MFRNDSFEEFRKRLPYKLIATNIPGAFTVPAPADHLDPNTATAITLARHGFLLRRPKKGDHPGTVAAWERVFSRRWRPEKRIVPHLVPQIGRTHHLRSAKKVDAVFNSNNWSGGTVQGNWVTSFGTWVIPTVSQPAEGQGQEGGWNSSSWVGIDGAYGSNDVLQAGVEQRVDGRGNASYVAWFEWFENSQKVILGDTSPLSPALASYNGNLYLAWKGDGNDNLNVMVSSDNGQTFGSKFISPETSPESPALTAHNGRLYIGWKGDGNDNLNVAVVNVDAFGDPTGFSNKITLGDTSPLSPALASYNGNLYLAWKGDGNNNLNVMVSKDNGQTFGNKFISPETSDDAPALGVFNGALYIAWKGSGNDNLNVAGVSVDGAGDPVGFFNKVTLGDTSPVSPSIASLNGLFYISWKGDGNDNLNVMSSTDGVTFFNKSISPETSPESPALAAHNGSLYVGWKGDGNDNLNVATAAELPVPPYVFQVNIPNFAVNPGDTVFCSVQYVGNRTAGHIYFANDTTGDHFILTIVPPPGASFSGNSIEWIMEAPDGGEPISALPSFTPVKFTGAFGCSSDARTVGDPQNGDIWNIVNSSANPPQTLTSVALGAGAVTINFTG